MPVKPSTPEEEFFARQELERKRDLARQREAQLRDEEQARLKELHWMHCPKCGADLLEIDFQGHRVDQCHRCRGIWLDAGEVDFLTASETGGFLASVKRALLD